MDSQFNNILETAIKANASDIHLTNNIKPSVRVDGVLRSLDNFEVNTPTILEGFVRDLLDKEQLEKYNIEKEIDSSTSYGDVRFRIHIYRQSGADAIALRIIPKRIPTFKELGIPPVLKKFTTMPNGLILITGVTGSGKSTTLASMINEINDNYSKHIITIEDPIEYIHTHKKSIVNQREIGTDVQSFARAVRAAMREDPDVVLVGELRDLDTIQNAITVAETGHLVFGTLHTKSVSETIGRIIDVFPGGQQEQIRIQLASSIKGIVSQNLLPKIGGGRVPSCEIMITNDAIKSLIRENQNPNAIVDQIQSNSKKTGSQTLIQSLASLVINKSITVETATKDMNEKDIEMLKKMIMVLSSERR